MVIPLPPRRRSVAVLCLGLFLIATALAPAAGLVRARHDAALLRTAPICPSVREVLIDVPAGCMASAATIVTKTYRSYTWKATDVWIAAISTPAGTAARGPYRFDQEAGVLVGLKVGDRVLVEVWRGTVVAITDHGNRTTTRDDPAVHALRWLAVTDALVFAGLALVVRWAVGVPLLTAGQWRIRFTEWRSVVLSTAALLAFGALFGLFTLLESAGGYEDPRLWSLAGFGAGAVGIVANSVTHNRRAMAQAAGASADRPRRIQRWWGYGLLAAGLILAVLATLAAFANAAEVARARVPTHAPPCAAGLTGNCLSTRSAFVHASDPSGDDPALWVDRRNGSLEWVYFTTDRRAFVQSLTVGDKVSLREWHERVVAVATADGTQVVRTDDAPFWSLSAALVAGVPALGLILAGVGLLLRRRRVWAVAGSVAVLAGATAAAQWHRSGWPYLLVVAFVLAVLPVRRRVEPGQAG